MLRWRRSWQKWQMKRLRRGLEGENQEREATGARRLPKKIEDSPGISQRLKDLFLNKPPRACEDMLSFRSPRCCVKGLYVAGAKESERRPQGGRSSTGGDRCTTRGRARGRGRLSHHLAPGHVSGKSIAMAPNLLAMDAKKNEETHCTCSLTNSCWADWV